MTATIVSGRDWGYEASRDFIDVTSSLPVADPNWVGTCPNGHPHAYRTIETTAPGRWGDTYWCEMCRDDHADWLGRFCAECGERVEVGTLPPPFTPQLIPGRISLSVWVLRYDGARLTYDAPESFLAWLKDHQQAASNDEVLAELDRCGAVLKSVEAGL